MRLKGRISAVTKGAALVVALAGISLVAAETAAATPPQIVSTTVEGVTATGLVLRGSVNPNGVSTNYRFEYLTEAAYEANLASDPPRESFAGATLSPSAAGRLVGAGSSPQPVVQSLSGLEPSTAYRYRLRAINIEGEMAFSAVRLFGTAAPTNSFELLDHRGWEMVSPIEKRGGAIQPPGAVFGGGVTQAAADGGSVTYSSADSFGEDAQGSPAGSQYLATRGGGGWATANITTPLLSGSYGSEPDGVPYQLFSGDLSLGLLSNGERCRGVIGGECPVANPPLPGSGAPAGYRDYYRRTSPGGFESILGAADLTHTSLGPGLLELRLVAATPGLSHIVLSSCAALTPDAVEVPSSGGCDPADQNLYEWSGGALELISLDPAGNPVAAAQIAAPNRAIAEDGARVYFTSGGDLYVHTPSGTKTVSASPAVVFAAASPDGSTAYLVDSGALQRYSVATGSLTTIDAGPGVEGVLGTSRDGADVYYARSGAVFLYGGTTPAEVASAALESDWRAGTSRVTRDGSRLLFLSAAELTGYPSGGTTEVFLYGPSDGGPGDLTCVSCNPSGERPRGDAAIPGSRPNGTGGDAIDVYEPRVLSADGNRVFFESADSLAAQDTNGGVVDVYEWETDGEGTCLRPGGCVQLISGGRDQAPSYFLDADEDGGEAFFLTAASLYPPDPGSYDVYDAREGGGFAAPSLPIPCVADACQVLPEAPEDETPGTLVPNSGNPPLEVKGGSNMGGKTKKSKKKHHKKRGKKGTGSHSKPRGKSGGGKK
jgi:hypothetical protein